ncbi:TetR family transcriptional regulator [Patulibacter sp. S7RM1-6]
MARWRPDARGRLQQAALDLFDERGFDETTVAEIAERAGLTKRTFFRHFADKREALFWGSGALQETFVAGIADAPADAAPLDAVAHALDAATATFDGRREHAVRRQRVVTGHPSLQERELIKLATLTAAVAHGLRERGVDEPAATLAAEAGVAVFRVAFDRWIADDETRSLQAVAREALAGLRAVAAG